MIIFKSNLVWLLSLGDDRNAERKPRSILETRRNLDLRVKLLEQLLGNEDTDAHALDALFELRGVQELDVLKLDVRLNFIFEELLQVADGLLLQDQLLVCEGKVYDIELVIPLTLDLKLLHANLAQPANDINNNLNHAQIITTDL